MTIYVQVQSSCMNKTKVKSTIQAQCVRYNENVNKIAGKLDNETFIDPFNLKNCPTNLVNIATGFEAPTDVKNRACYVVCVKVR